MLLMIDNYDSFVYNLVRYFEELGEDVETIRNDCLDMDALDPLKYTGIIISPGPKSPTEAGASLETIHRFKGRIPILGICLGHQCIGHYFGGKIIKGTRPFHGKITAITHMNNNLFNGLPNPLNVTRYHSLIIDTKKFPTCLEVTAKTDEGTIMGIAHKTLPIYGVQFHPEAELTQEGHALLKNFIRISEQFYEL